MKNIDQRFRQPMAGKLLCSAVGDYYGTTDEGTDLYSGPGGSFADENGIPLAITAGTDINLANGGSQTFGSGSTPPAPLPPTATVVSAGGTGNSNALAGVAGIFEAVGTAIGVSVKALTPSKPTTLPGSVGSYVYNPQTGQYLPAVQGTSSISTSSLLLVGIVALGLVILLKK